MGSNDLKKCGLVENWNEMSVDRKMLRGLVHSYAEEVNEDLAELEQRIKMKERRGIIMRLEAMTLCCFNGNAV